ncbi:MAG: L-alanine-DL-glutamate epimerase, partial [Hungatella sp.]
DMNGIKRLKESDITVPIAYGESMRIYYAYETYAEKGVDHLQPSVGRMSKMEDLLKIRDLARRDHLRFSSGGRIYLNAIFGCLYDEDELIEYHEPISKPVGAYTLYQPIEKDGRFYCPDDIPGNPQRMDIEKLEKDGFLESKKIFYTIK